MKQKRWGRVRTLGLGIVAMLAIAGGLSLYVTAQKEKLASLKSAVAALERAHVPLRFKVEGRTAGGVAVKLKLYDMDDKEIAVARRTLPGESLFLDFVTVPVAKRYLHFPKALFTEAVPAEAGVALFPLYDDDGFPRVFAAAGIDGAARDELEALFGRLKQGQAVGGVFGNAVHDVKEFKRFEVGVVYQVVSRLKGGLEIVEEEK